MHVAIVLFDGFDNLDAIGPFEVFSHAKTFGADVEVGLYALDDQAVVTSSHGLRVETDGVLGREDAEITTQGDGSRPEQPDIVVVPGGGWNSEGGVWREAQRGRLPDLLGDLSAAGATVASVCTGGMLLAHAGLVDGQPAVTHQSALDDLRDAGATVVDARVVDDGNILTAGGVTAGIDLALHLVEREWGTDIAERVAAEMEYDRSEDVYRSPEAAEQDGDQSSET
jgi:transcriptional regulator GlxA family with amidase domain